MGRFVAWEAGDEVLHVHPSPESSSPEDDLVAMLVDDLRAFYGQNAGCHGSVVCCALPTNATDAVSLTVYHVYQQQDSPGSHHHCSTQQFLEFSQDLKEFRLNMRQIEVCRHSELLHSSPTSLGVTGGKAPASSPTVKGKEQGRRMIESE